VPTLAPSTVAEAETVMTTLRSSLSDRIADPTGARRTLTDIHKSLMQATPSTTAPPLHVLGLATALLADLPTEVADGLPPRPRTVFRLLRAGQPAAAWEVLGENAVGVVDQVFTAATATGATRAVSRLPVLSRIEAPTAFAELPGFRDPRFAVPDECYDITDMIGLRHGLDEIYLEATTVSLGGWAVLDQLPTDPDETVTVVASGADGDVAVTGSRRRRADLVGTRGQALTRQAWAGWSASIDLTSPRFRNGSWVLSLQIDHAGVVRRCPLGAQLGAIARSATRSTIRIDGRRIGVTAERQQLRLACSGAASDTVGG
jgi:hypothetical protein